MGVRFSARFGMLSVKRRAAGANERMYSWMTRRGRDGGNGRQIGTVFDLTRCDRRLTFVWFRRRTSVNVDPYLWYRYNLGSKPGTHRGTLGGCGRGEELR
jgi:hypothetical protein